MKLLALVPIVLSIAAEAAAATLTFEQALALATARVTPPSAPSIGALRRGKLPNVRIEVTGNTSRTLDLFSEGPLEVRYGTSVVALDYPLWDGGAHNARLDAAEARWRGEREQRALDDSRFVQLLDAFGELYLAQRQQALIRPLLNRLEAEADRSTELLASGEISNLTAMERRDAALALASRALELSARRIETAARLKLLTGLEEEPEVQIDLVAPAADRPPLQGEPALHDDLVDATTIAFEESRARLREVTATSGFSALLSGFAGIGAAGSHFRDVTSQGSFGVYGLRIHLSYPIFRGTSALPLAEARANVERARIARDNAVDAARARRSDYLRREDTARQRIALMRMSVDASKAREESLTRLVEAGVRSEADLGYAQAERSRRELDLLAAEIELWKAVQLSNRMTGASGPS